MIAIKAAGLISKTREVSMKVQQGAGKQNAERVGVAVYWYTF